MKKFVETLLLVTLGSSFASLARAQLAAHLVASGLTNPVALVQDPANPNVQYIVQKTGQIKVLQNGSIQGFNFVDVSTEINGVGERGLLNLTFAPDYAISGYSYLYYVDLNGDSHLARFTRSLVNPYTADRTTEYPIITVAQPKGSYNHKGGTVKFGPDNFLYWALGDGNPNGDPVQNAQNPFSLLGKVLRIDPSHDQYPNDPTRNYAIPADNPFVSGNPISAAPEIWDFGLRNPYKFSFDSGFTGSTGALIIGDVGQDAWEELNYEAAGHGGRNYGWRLREGKHETGYLSAYAFSPTTDPIFEYNHHVGHAIIGGYVYRGSALSSTFRGKYFFADEVDGKLFTLDLTINQDGSATASNLQDLSAQVGGRALLAGTDSVDEDSAGELYLSNYFNGTIYKIVHS